MELTMLRRVDLYGSAEFLSGVDFGLAIKPIDHIGFAPKAPSIDMGRLRKGWITFQSTPKPHIGHVAAQPPDCGSLNSTKIVGLG
jgi:hypothetical protein